MQRFPATAFEVRWFPFQLNPNASKTGVNKLEMYSQKFRASKQQIMQRMEGMKQRFLDVGLPYKFTEDAVTGNTFNSHRLIAYAGSVGLETQDKVVEALFHAYFAEEKFLNDPLVLECAAVQAGIPEETAKQFVADESIHREQTDQELTYGRELNVTGVPFFVVQSQGRALSLSGAQPPEAFEQVFNECLT